MGTCSWVNESAVASRWSYGLVVAAVVVGLSAGAVEACTCDCNGDGVVSADEVVVGTQIALGQVPLSACPEVDRSADDEATIEELVRGAAASGGCPAPLIARVAGVVTEDGSGLAGYDGDDKLPTDTALYLPQDTTVGPDGLLYIVDWNNHRIRKVDEDGRIKTIAGSGELGQPSNDADALYAQFNHPTNIAFDHEGRVLIASWHNSMVIRLDPATGRIAIIAGTGARAFGGDEGPATQAALDLPSSVAVTSTGDMVISDQANFRIRLLDPAGIIHTICGDGTAGDTGDGGPALLARLKAEKGQSAPPAGRLVVDAQDRIYVADTGNHRVRLIDTDRSIRTIVGTGTAGYSGDDGAAIDAQLKFPRDLALSPNGTLYIADTGNSVVRVVRPDGTIDTLAGSGEQGFAGIGGPADSAQLNQPFGVSVAPNGQVYIADTHNHRILKVSDEEPEALETPTPTPTPVIIPCTDTVGSICTYAGNGGTGFAGDDEHRLRSTLYWPFDIEFSASRRRIVLDWNNHKIREILEDESLSTIVGTDFVGDGPLDLSDLSLPGAPPLSVDLNHPTDIQELGNGDVLFAAWHNHKIRVLTKETGLVRTLIGRGPGFVGDGRAASTLPLALVNQPSHVALDMHGNLFVLDQRNQRIRVLYNFEADRENAVIDTVAGNPDPPAAGALPKGGYNGDGEALSTKLNFLTGGNPEPSGGLAIDKLGNLYFSDTNNHLIRRVQFTSADFKTGVVTTIAGSPGNPGFSGDGELGTDARVNAPADMEIGPDDNLYFADTNNHRVRMINLTDGTISTVAGSGSKGYSGDGGPALDAQLNRPFGVAFDLDGDLYVSDTFNSRIRKVKLQ